MKHLNLLAFVIFSLLLGWVFMFSTDTKRKIQRPILSVFGVVNKTAHALSADEDVVNGVNLGPGRWPRSIPRKSWRSAIATCCAR